MINPLTNEKVSKNHAEIISRLRTIRRNARAATRSGHPGRRAEAYKALAMVPGEIWQMFQRDAQRHHMGIQ